jgi:hypothetical protein
MVLWQVLWERVGGQGTQAVLRVIVPGAAEPGYADMVQDDLDWLCETHAAPLSALPAARSDEVVVTIMDRPVPRGATDPEARQFFGVYAMRDGACVPEGF